MEDRVTTETGNNRCSSSNKIPKISKEGRDASLSGIPFLPAAIVALFMLVMPIIFVWFCYISIHSYLGSMALACQEILESAQRGQFLMFVVRHTPSVTAEGVILFCSWITIQALLHVYLPGPKGYGQRTPSGNIITYNCNGLRCWILTHILVLIAVWAGWMRSTIFYDNVGTILIMANALGIFMTIFCYFKAYEFPSHPEDRRFSGSVLYDLFMGIEHNPGLGSLDFKHFFNTRPGILGWTLINLSCAVRQYYDIGYVTNSMILVNFLQGVYVLDLFYKEDWYLRTVDITHDHFGFYLAWGDLTWLPFMYTLQGYYLVQNPVNLPDWASIAVLVLGLSGYYIFRSANTQKDEFRKTVLNGGTFFINGKPAVFVPASYITDDGEKHFSPLLASGWWALARHFNYIGDLLNALSYCLPCGFHHALPYFYIVYMLILLLHRVFRDNIRCSEKYGKYWDEYCKLVPYKLIPGIY